MQLANIKLVAVNSSVLQDKQKMYNKIRQHVESQVSLTVAGNKNIQDYQNAIQRSETTAINNIQMILEKAVSMEVGSDQSVTIDSTAPLKCVHKCGEMPSAGTVTQNTQIEIYAKNIASTVLSDIQKNYDNMSIQTDISFKDVNYTQRMIFISFTIYIVITFLSDLGILAYAAAKLPKTPQTYIVLGVITAALIGSLTIFLIFPNKASFITFYIY